MDLTAENFLLLAQSVIPFNSINLTVYGVVSRADQYFNNRLRNVFWLRASLGDKTSALIEATTIIDTLNFAGIKADPNQLHQFPRATYPANFPNIVLSTIDVVVPRDIEYACYEIAIQLLSGVDPDLEVENLATHSQGFSSARTTYERAYILDHIAAGVPSARAWALLKPYLRDPRRLNISRAD